MSIKDLRSNLKVSKIISVSGNTAATLASSIYDSGKDEATMFMFSSPLATAANIKVSSIEEGNAANLSDATTVPALKIIGVQANVDITLAGHATQVFTLGVYSNKRYLRVNLAITTPGAGNAIEVMAVAETSLLPATSPGV